MSPGSRLMAGTRYSETFLLTASTSANRLGSKLPRETRTTAVAGNDSVMVILSLGELHYGSISEYNEQPADEGRTAEEPGPGPGDPVRRGPPARRARLRPHVAGIGGGRRRHHRAQPPAPVPEQGGAGRRSDRLATGRGPARRRPDPARPRPGDLGELPQQPAGHPRAGHPRLTARRRRTPPRTTPPLQDPHRRAATGAAPASAGGRRPPGLRRPRRAHQHAHRLLLRPLRHHRRHPRRLAEPRAKRHMATRHQPRVTAP